MGHEYQDRVSMELARRVAAELPERPEWLRMARDNLRRWIALNHDAPGLLGVYAKWQAILDQSPAEICRFLLSSTEEAQTLRHSSPFAGAIPPAEVWAIKERLRHDQSAA